MSGGDASQALRVAVDVNIWVSYFESLQNARSPSALAELVSMLRDMRAGDIDLQLVMSTEMFGTLERVLERKGFSAAGVSEFVSSVEDLVRTGPAGDEPHFLPAGRDQLAMRDREDAGVLAAAMIVRADLLVTDNLKHFDTNDSESLETKEVAYPNGALRQLRAIIHERCDGVALVVAHPFDVLDWFRTGMRPTPESVRARYGAASGYEP